MFGIEKFSISLSFNFMYLLLGIIILGAYTFFIYRYTVPKVSPFLKYVLIFLRAVSIVIILFLIFEPNLLLNYNKESKPAHLVYIDNSKSISSQTEKEKKEEALKFIDAFESSRAINDSKIFSFGTSVNAISADSLKDLKFSETATNFSQIFSSAEKLDNENIASITIISDGNVTEGEEPVFSAEKLDIPIYTVGVGDTTTKKDIELRRVLYNEYIYAGTPTAVNFVIYNEGYAGSSLTISFYEGSKLIGRKDITIEEGAQNVNFDYTPSRPGEVKLSASISGPEDEASKANNSKTFYLNILDNKIRALFVAGAPSSDLSFIKSSLSADENFRIDEIITTGQNKVLGAKNIDQALDSANILFLVGFPSKETSNDLLNKVINQIRNKKKPFLITLSQGIDLNKLKSLQAELPFSIGRISSNMQEAQPNVVSVDGTLLQSGSGSEEIWNDLPPVLRSATEFTPKPGSEVLSKIKIRNIPINTPLIISRRFGESKSLAILAQDIWKWKLQSTSGRSALFDGFVNNAAKWMNIREDRKQVSVRTSKKLYPLGERIEFIGQVYDPTFFPIEDAELTASIKLNSEEYSLTLNSMGGGLYQEFFNALKEGDYEFTAEAKLNGASLGKDSGKFSVGDFDVEAAAYGMNKDFLKLLAGRTNGAFYYKNYDELFNRLDRELQSRSSTKLVSAEYNLWSNEWLLILLIILFSAEWFLRKRAGML